MVIQDLTSIIHTVGLAEKFASEGPMTFIRKEASQRRFPHINSDSDDV